MKKIGNFIKYLFVKKESDEVGDSYKGTGNTEEAERTALKVLHELSKNKKR